MNKRQRKKNGKKPRCYICKNMVFEENVGCYSFERYCDLECLAEEHFDSFDSYELYRSRQCKKFERGEPIKR